MKKVCFSKKGNHWVTIYWCYPNFRGGALPFPATPLSKWPIDQCNVNYAIFFAKNYKFLADNYASFMPLFILD